MKLIGDVPVWGEPVDEGALNQIIRCRANAYGVALMADHHKGYSVPIGGVVAYESAISPSGVGYDIACGNKAVLTDMTYADLQKKGVAFYMDKIYSTLSFGIGRKNEERVDAEMLNDGDPAWQIGIVRKLKDKAAAQLGTIGSGNHYVDLLRDEQDRIWIGVHFGSRGFGHGIATYYLKQGGATDTMDAYPLILKAEGDLGSEYLAAMALAGRYAYAGRDWVCWKVSRLLGAKIKDEVHNHHNFAWRENHNGENVWVVRKGATPAFPGQRGFVGGSMGDISVILEGTESEEGPYSLYSTVHGAGRVMSRTAARGKINWKTGEVKSPGLISPEMMNEWLQQKNVVLRGGGLDEAPQAYKRIEQVLGYHSDSIKIPHTLQPLGVAMAGHDVRDPYRD